MGDIVTIISKAGGSKTPSSLPAVDAKPDPLFTYPPPWKDQTITQVQNKETVESVKPKESLYGFLKKGTKVMSSKPITTVSDSSKKPSWEINSKKDENTKNSVDNSTAQNVHLTFPDETKIPTCQPEERVETGRIETMKEKECSNGKYENQKIANFSSGMYASFREKMSKKKVINQEPINPEPPTRRNIKLKKLVDNVSLRLSKGNKETKVPIDENGIDHKSLGMSTVEKFKRSFLSVSNKQTINKDSDFCSSKQNEEKIIETKQEDPSIDIAQANKKDLNITKKLKSLKVYKPKLFMNKKLNKEEEKVASTEKEATFGIKIKKQFESSKSRVAKNKKDRIEESNEIKQANKIDSIRKKCSTVFKNDDHNKKHQSGDKENIGKDSKASATLKSFQLKLSYKGRTKKEGKENGGQISTDKTLQSQSKKDLTKSKFSNIFSKGKETEKGNKASGVMSINNIEKRIMNTREIEMRKRDTKFQWIMIDGQWRKSESFGV